jgi:hypothetical protein
MTGMVEAGLDPANDDDAEEYGYRVLQKYFEHTTIACKRKNPELRVFHNSGHVPKGSHAFLKWNSHLELESLPTGGWGYDHFPLSAKYAATTGMDFLGMTGKFHSTWGEFGGFKRPNALRYECAAMLAFGSKCSVGDQLHPDGAMNRDTYELIGAAYSEVKEKETWCVGATPHSEVALVSPEAFYIDKPGFYRRKGKAEEGAGRMLLELQVQFDVVDLERDLAPYRLVILPDEVTLEGDFATKMQNYVANGGKVILSGRSGMTPESTEFVLDAGLDIEGPGEYDPDYLIPGAELPTPPVRERFVVHGGAWKVRPKEGTRVLAQSAVPYFNRRWDHFCSHQHTPNAQVSEFPAITATDSIVYFAHNIFTAYRQLGQPLYRDLVQDAIRLLLGDLSLQTNLPTAARASLMHQLDESRHILHLLYAVPVKRGADESIYASGVQAVEVIEDLVPLHNIECSVRMPQVIKGVRLAPSGENIEYSTQDGVVTFTVPKLLCHQMVELAY